MGFLRGRHVPFTQVVGAFAAIDSCDTGDVLEIVPKGKRVNHNIVINSNVVYSFMLIPAMAILWWLSR